MVLTIGRMRCGSAVPNSGDGEESNMVEATRPHASLLGEASGLILSLW